MDCNGVGVRGVGDVNGAEVVGGAAGGLKESGDKFTGGREVLEVGP